jgi:hypothetical protein
MDDIALPADKRQFTLPAGVSVGPDGDLIATPFPITLKKAGEASEEGVSAAFATGDIIAVLKELDEYTGMTGVRAWGGTEIGGRAAQVHPGLGEFVTEGLTGVSLEKLQSFRTRLTMLTSPLIPVITGETGRYTEIERDETKTAMAALKVARSASQIKGALFSILESYAMRLAKVGFVLGRPIDVKTRGGILKELRRLVSWGFSMERAERVIKKIKHAHRELDYLRKTDPESYKEMTGK